MNKVIDTEKYAKSFYTKSQIRYIKEKGWAFVLESMVPGGCKFVRNGWSYNSGIKEIMFSSQKQIISFEKKMMQRVKVLLAKIPEDIDAFYKQKDAREAAAKKLYAKLCREEDEIATMLKNDGMSGIYSTINNLRTGEHTGSFSAMYDRVNSVTCYENRDYDGYSRSCTFPLITRSFTLHIRKGWHVLRIGGLLTFVKGSVINRDGMACEWIEQGRSIADIRTVKGFLVRGEHIEAKSLKEAKAINAEHRAMTLARLLSSRKKVQRRNEQKANGTLRITFQDSLNAGNCRPGTSEFRYQYEAAIGRKAKDITIADLRKYARKFGVEYYAERVIEYALNH